MLLIFSEQDITHQYFLSLGKEAALDDDH